ncbi:MAG: DUF4870 domain-containing protein [Odoribacter splanchnicus]|nr:DUF4870 domain-containing protein [Odoribacter splanchnicus]
MNYDELEKLNDLRQRGVISEEEFQQEKEKILNHNPAKILPSTDANQYSMFIHLSQFLGIFTGIGIIVPVILWLIKKDESPVIDNNGKIVINWILSLLIYAACAGILCIIVIGIPLLIALAVCDFIFIILGSIKASSGVLWKYPLSIEFFTIKP